MSKIIETNGQLTVSIAWGGRPLLSAHFQHQSALAGEGRRALRALRARAMAELGKAWAEPASKGRWREGPR